ncbi:MAG: MFS transporter [Bacteriovoracaceae bacterium]|nr:MFS transporter [Bacteriovoracaceae bacterium]
MSTLLSDKRFWPLFWTQFLGALNDNFFKNALVILITYKSVTLFGLGSGLLVAAAGGIFIFPFFIFSATAGQLADRFEKSKVIFITKVTELCVMILASIGFYLDNYALLMIVLFMMGAQSAFFGPLKYGIIPHLIKKEELVQGNAFVGGGTFLAILIGTILGGLVVTLPNYFAFLSIGLILLALVGIISSTALNKVGNSNPDVKIDFTLFRPSWQILKMTAKDKLVFNTIIGISWFWFLGAGILSLLPVMSKDVLFGGEKVGTMFLATFTIGMGIGSMMSDKFSKKKVEIGMVAPAALLLSFFMVDMYWVGSHWKGIGSPDNLLGVKEFFTQDNSIRIFFDLMMISVFGGMYIIPQMTFVQEGSDPKELSRIISGNNIINALFMVSAAIMIMILHTLKVTVPMQFGILGGMNLLMSFYIYYVHSEKTVRFVMQIFSHTFYKLEVKGHDNIPKDGPIILATNHVTYIDWIFIMAASPRPVRFIIDNAFYSLPTGKFWFSQAGLIPIATRKESAEVLEKAFSNISQNIKEGHCLGIFPEGWITRDGKIKKFQPGLIKIIKKDPVSIVPVTLEGLWGSIFSFEGGKIIFKFPKTLRRTVVVHIGQPITPEEYCPDKMRNHMLGVLGKTTGDIVNE